MARTCEWYLACTNEATDTVEHPALGPVPICERCKARLDALLMS